jgi:hypothetical protein
MMSVELKRDRLVQFLASVDGEILNMCSGEGKHRPGTLHFEQGKNSCPVMNRLEILKNTPTPKNLEEFLVLAAQDFGQPTADYFRGQSQAIFIETAEVKKPFVKAFDVAVKDSFYDMFRTARIAMEPKQVERIEAISLQLAGTIQSEVSKKVAETVKIQLGALVSQLKLDEEKRAAAREVQREKAAAAVKKAPVKKSLAERTVTVKD